MHRFPQLVATCRRRTVFAPVSSHGVEATWGSARGSAGVGREKRPSLEPTNRRRHRNRSVLADRSRPRGTRSSALEIETEPAVAANRALRGEVIQGSDGQRDDECGRRHHDVVRREDRREQENRGHHDEPCSSRGPPAAPGALEAPDSVAAWAPRVVVVRSLHCPLGHSSVRPALHIVALLHRRPATRLPKTKLRCHRRFLL